MKQLGYTDKEAEIFLAIYKFGPKPASTIANMTDIDRTYCYKVLSTMVHDKLLNETIIKWVKNFFVPNPEVLLDVLSQRQKKFDDLHNQFDGIKNELLSYETNKIAYAPQIILFEGNEWIQNLYKDIVDTIKKRKLLAIKFFASSTFTSQIMKNKAFEDFHTDFITDLSHKNIIIDGYIGSGVLTMESMDRITSNDDIKKIVPGYGSTHGYLIGKCLYMLQFKEVPLGFKIENFDMTDMFHFVFEHLKTN